MRYDTETSQDGLPRGEGAFLACSFWLVDAYILQNRWADARALFDRLLTLRNDVGLLSEEYDPRAGRLVADDEGAHPDTEADLLAHDAGIDGGAATAEEAAVRVVDEDDYDIRSGD